MVVGIFKSYRIGIRLSGHLPLDSASGYYGCFASGYRNSGSGALNDVGAWGGSWSSSPAASGSANASNLNFRATNVNPLNSNNRANGLPVRCVKYLHEFA